MEEIAALIKPLLELFSGNLGFLAQLVAFMGTARLFLKPFQLLEKPLLEFIRATETKKDDELFDKAKDSKFFKTAKFLIDYLFSLKLK
jgi:hypothetical protein